MTPKMKRFCEYYVGEADFNGAKAARMAGYKEKTADRTAYENLRKPEIKNLVSKLSDELYEIIRNNRIKYLKKLDKSACFNIKDYFKDGSLQKIEDMSDDVSFTITKFKTIRKKDGEEYDTIDEVVTLDKLKAIEMMLKLQGQYEEHIPINQTFTIIVGKDGE